MSLHMACCCAAAVCGECYGTQTTSATIDSSGLNGGAGCPATWDPHYGDGPYVFHSSAPTQWTWHYVVLGVPAALVITCGGGVASAQLQSRLTGVAFFGNADITADLTCNRTTGQLSGVFTLSGAGFCVAGTESVTVTLS